VHHVQDDLIENIEQHVESTVDKTDEAGKELTKAAEYQRKSRKVTLCIFGILIILLGAIILWVVFIRTGK
jgi:syntaxin 7